MTVLRQCRAEVSRDELWILLVLLLSSRSRRRRPRQRSLLVDLRPVSASLKANRTSSDTDDVGSDRVCWLCFLGTKHTLDSFAQFSPDGKHSPPTLIPRVEGNRASTATQFLRTEVVLAASQLSDLCCTASGRHPSSPFHSASSVKHIYARFVLVTLQDSTRSL